MQNAKIKITNQKLFYTPFLIFAFCILSFAPRGALASGTTNITIEILALCGNNIKESGEQCDGTDLGSASCTSQGYTGGTLSCNSSCASFNTSSCTSGGGGYVAPVTSAIFNGRAFLKDAQIVATTIADANANFSLTISGLTGGNYIFSVYSEDAFLKIGSWVVGFLAVIIPLVVLIFALLIII